MKKITIAIAAVIFLFSVNYAVAESATQGVPFQALWDAVAQINTRITQEVANLQSQINNISLTPGPKGDKGDKGDIGEQGVQGERGLQGEQGVQGIQGIQGEQGSEGPQGQQGQIGAPGLVIGFDYLDDFSSARLEGTPVNTYYDIPGRAISYNKIESNSLLHITYTDFAFIDYTSAPATCAWQLVVDGVPYGDHLDMNAYASSASRFLSNLSYDWILRGLGTGAHELKIQYTIGNSNTIRCINPGSTASNLIIEEITTP